LGGGDGTDSWNWTSSGAVLDADKMVAILVPRRLQQKWWQNVVAKLSGKTWWQTMVANCGNKIWRQMWGQHGDTMMMGSWKMWWQSADKMVTTLVPNRWQNMVAKCRGNILWQNIVATLWQNVAEK